MPLAIDANIDNHTTEWHRSHIAIILLRWNIDTTLEVDGACSDGASAQKNVCLSILIL